MAAPPPADFAKAVTFIFLATEQGGVRTNPQTNAPVANGTGFFVLFPSENGQGFTAISLQQNMFW